MYSKFLTIALLCTTIFSVQAFAIESSSSSSSLSTSIISSSIASSSTNSTSISSNNSNSFNSQNSSNSILPSSISSSINSNSISSSSSTNSNSSAISCQVAASSQDTKTSDEDKVECDNADIESDKDDKSKDPISKKEKKRYKQCKKDEQARRKNSHKNFETACKKKPKKIVHDLTDEDYNILFDNLDQVKDEIKPLTQISSRSSTKTISVSSNVSTSSKTSFLNTLFGNVKAEAAMTDGFKLPFANGTRVTVQQDVHDGQSHGEYGAHAALDLTGGVNNGESIKATKSGTVILTRDRVEAGFGNHVVVQMDEGGYAIYGHLSSITVSKDSRINQGAEIGKMGNTGLSDPTAYHIHLETISSLPSCKYSSTDQYNPNQVSVNGCWSTLPSIDLKPQFVECYSGISAEMNTCGYWRKADGTWTYPNIPTNPNSYTSQNKPIYNNYGGFIKAATNDQLVFDVEGSNTADQTLVKLAQGKWSGDNMNQRWGYNAATKQIKGLNDKCLDAGDVNNPQNRWLRINTCHGGNNQKWERDNVGRVHSLANYNQCIDGYGGGVYAGQTVAAWDCHGYDNQKWNVADLNMPLAAQIVDSTMDRVQPATNDYMRALDSGCGLNNIIVIKYRDNGDCQKLKYDYGTNSIRNPFGQCIDAGNMNSTQKLVFYTCNNSANQKWFHESGNNRIWSQQKDNANRTRCIEYSALNNGDEVYILPCSTDSRQRWYNGDLNITQASVPGNNFNNFSQEIWPADNGGFKFDVTGANPTDGTSVKLVTSNGNIAQKWGYDWNTHQLKGLNDKCLDAGDINDPNNRWLRLNTCHSGSNQKWFIDNINRIHSEAKTSLCIDSPWGNSSGSQLYMGACHNGNNQKWSGNVNMLRQETFFPIYSAYNQSFGFDIYGGTDSNQTPIKMWGLGNNQWNEVFEYNSTTQELRNRNGKCVDGGNVNDSNNRWIRINDCNNGSQQKWYTDGGYRIHSAANGSLCVDSYSGDNYNSTLYLGGCHDYNNQKWWVKGWLS
jgi:murein DD-endopeptidase MepM/ murein hydrolase activator NlpD